MRRPKGGTTERGVNDRRKVLPSEGVQAHYVNINFPLDCICQALKANGGRAGEQLAPRQGRTLRQERRAPTERRNNRTQGEDRRKVLPSKGDQSLPQICTRRAGLLCEGIHQLFIRLDMPSTESQWRSSWGAAGYAARPNPKAGAPTPAGNVEQPNAG